MKNFTNEQSKALMEQAQEIMNGIADGESTRDVMARLYVENLDDKTIAQGLVIADSIIESVKNFDASYKEARENLDGYIKKFQKKMDEGKSCVERCNYWLKITAAVSAASIALNDPTVDRKKLLEEMELITPITEEEATPAKEREIKKQAREAIKNSGIMFNGLMEHASELDASSSPEEAAEMIIEIGDKDCDLRAIAAMLAYTQVKNGSIENVPADITAPQLTTFVCAGVEEMRITEAVGNGSLAEDIASLLLFVLGAIVIIQTIVALGALGLLIIPGLFTSILIIPAIMVMVFGLFKLLTKGLSCWSDVSEKFVKCVFAAGKAVLKGIKALVLFIKDKVIPKIVEVCKNIFKAIGGFFSKGKKTEVEQPAEVPAT